MSTKSKARVAPTTLPSEVEARKALQQSIENHREHVMQLNQAAKVASGIVTTLLLLLCTTMNAQQVFTHEAGGTYTTYDEASEILIQYNEVHMLSRAPNFEEPIQDVPRVTLCTYEAGYRITGVDECTQLNMGLPVWGDTVTTPHLVGFDHWEAEIAWWCRFTSAYKAIHLQSGRECVVFLTWEKTKHGETITRTLYKVVIQC